MDFSFYLSAAALVAIIVTWIVVVFIAFRRHHKPQSARGFKLSQKGFKMISGVPLGGQGTFTEVPSPAGSALQGGSIPQWSADDTLAVLTPSADGTSVVVAIPASDTATSFNLKCSGFDVNGNPISTSVPVPILPAVPPPPVPATGFTIDQIA